MTTRWRRRAVLRLGAGVVALTVVGVGLGGGVAVAQSPQPAPSGPITFTPAVGTQDTIFMGRTEGPCNNAGANAYNAVVSGPGVFTPNEATGNTDGLTFAGTQINGFSAAAPNDFSQRISFADLAMEAGGPLLAGTYTVTFRCVDEFLLTIFQTYRTTFTVGELVAGIQPITANNPTGGSPTATPVPGSSTPVPTAGTPTPAASTTPTPTAAASRTPTPTATASTTPTPVPGASPTPVPSRTPAPGATSVPTGGSGTGGSGTGAGTLAYTGSPLEVLVPAGLVLSALGAGLLIARRRRTQG